MNSTKKNLGRSVGVALSLVMAMLSLVAIPLLTGCDFLSLGPFAPETHVEIPGSWEGGREVSFTAIRPTSALDQTMTVSASRFCTNETFDMVIDGVDTSMAYHTANQVLVELSPSVGAMVTGTVIVPASSPACVGGDGSVHLTVVMHGGREGDQAPRLVLEEGI